MNRQSWKLAVVIVLLVHSLLAQVGRSNRSPSGKTLITVSVRPDQVHFQHGNDLRVEVTLTAGPEGAYVPNFFGDFNQTCQTGFWADIFTPQGKLASARELLAKKYTFLKPGERRLWHIR